MKKLSKALAAAALAGAAYWPAAQATPVALELVLLVDVSGSVSNAEYLLQRNGYVSAFNNATIQSNIASLTGGIAVTYIEWSGANQQSTQVGWTLITDAATSGAFATSIFNTTRAFDGATAPGNAISFATPLFGTETGGTANGFESLRQVIDVSGDGAQNDGADTSTARDNSLLAGTDTINGLAILGEPGLAAFYQNNIVGGTNAFLLTAATFADFEQAVITKIGREIIVDVPEPGSMALAGLALVGLAALRRRQSA